MLILPVLGIFSYGKGDGFDRHMGMAHIDLMQKELGLSSEQIKKIEEVMSRHFDLMEVQRLAVEKEFLNLKEELLKESPDLGKIKSIIDKKSLVESEIEFGIVKRDLEIKSILTKEQFAKMRTLRNPMKMKMGRDDYMERREDCREGKDKFKKGDKKKKFK